LSYTFAAVLLVKLIKKGRGIGPMKPLQPSWFTHSGEGANSSYV